MTYMYILLTLLVSLFHSQYFLLFLFNFKFFLLQHPLKLVTRWSKNVSDNSPKSNHIPLDIQYTFFEEMKLNRFHQLNYIFK